MGEWIEHRRTGDRELLGWIRIEGDDCVPIDRFGREVTGPTDWLGAEEALDELGIGWLADLWQLTLETGDVVRVRVLEVTPERIVVKRDDFGAIDNPLETWTLPFPAPPELAPFAGDPGVIDGGF